MRRHLIPGLVLGAGLLLTERVWARSGRYTLERSQLVRASREQVFGFFADPRNLPVITPPWIHFKIEQLEQMPLTGGTVQEYRIRWLGVPLRWETLIAEFEHDRRFTDVQTRGPYRYWRHEHCFEDAEGGTRAIDRVQYELPFGPLGRLAHALLVRRQLQQIFDYRARVIEEVFGR